MPDELQLTQKINDVEKDVAVLQTEVGHYGKIMERLDAAVSTMSKVSSNLERLLIVHEERIKNTADNLEAHKRDAAAQASDISMRIDRLELHKEQIDKWRWHIGGVWAAVVAMAGVLGKVTGLW